MQNKKILVIAAHPDDEVLGCGGTIAKYSKDNEINCLILGEGITSRYKNREEADKNLITKLKQDAQTAAVILGIKNLILKDLPDNRFDSVDLLDIVKIVENVIEKFQPEIIFTHSNTDLNIDHRITFQAVLTATRPINNYCVKEIYSFEIPSSSEWSFGKINGIFNPNLFIDITENIDKKIKALKIYDTEINEFPHPRSEKSIISNAQKWGSVSGLKKVEAFEAVRIIK